MPSAALDGGLIAPGCIPNGAELDRFLASINRLGPVPEHDSELGSCWIWIGSIVNGYGGFSLKGRMRFAHRVAWLIDNRSWPRPFCLHRCAVRRCVRVSHLYEGTPTRNAQDFLDHHRFKMAHPSAEDAALRARMAEESTAEWRRISGEIARKP